ncbi:hypothetical protein GCM10007913_11220 [Devosia yakushimensis]|uniref:Uncharacterized protein n=1 Tax=Devosia yakushimensis TaxID=470028 RepID=A0ABQ5UDB3_9HYPH|nr:hypothetical protein [Devosia yakushimensis]GLQ09190.1 hypothetical protein GCM10007913_11220 [Devosia yakushimensis]
MLALSLAPGQPRTTPWPSDTWFGIDFASGRSIAGGRHVPLTDALTFARASDRLVRTNAGHWQAAGPGQPAISDLGLSLEPERTNTVVFNTGNSGAGILLTGTTLANLPAGSSPARDAHGKRAIQGSGNTDGVTRHSLSTLGGTTYSWSQSFKYDGSAWVRFMFSDNVAHGLNVWLDLQTMTVGTASVFGNAVLHSHALTPEGNGWYRLSMTGAVPNTASGGLSSYVCTANGNSTRQAGSYCLWGTQMETGKPTSPILTFGASETRRQDQAVLSLPAGAHTLRQWRAGAPQAVSVPGGAYTLPADDTGGFIQWLWSDQS